MFKDEEVCKFLANTPENLVLDRIILLQARKTEQRMQKLAKEKLKTYQKGQSSRKKKIQSQQYSDHYTFMFELMRRLKVKVKRIVNTDLGNEGPAGCKLIMERVFKEFSRIARNAADIERISLEGPRNNYLFDGKEVADEDIDDIEEFEDCESEKKVAMTKARLPKYDKNGQLRKKRKYVRKNQVEKKETKPTKKNEKAEAAAKKKAEKEAKASQKKKRSQSQKKNEAAAFEIVEQENKVEETLMSQRSNEDAEMKQEGAI